MDKLFCGFQNVHKMLRRKNHAKSHIAIMGETYISNLLENSLYEEVFKRFLPEHTNQYFLFRCHTECKFLLNHIEILKNPNNWKNLRRICLSNQYEHAFYTELEEYDLSDSPHKLIVLLQRMKWESLMQLARSNEYQRFVEELYLNSKSIAKILNSLYDESHQ